MCGKRNSCANPKRGEVRRGKQMCESKKRWCAARGTDVRIQKEVMCGKGSRCANSKRGDVRQEKQMCESKTE
eukprot:3954457-Pleurochrysis_carterae.AAC.1